MIGWRWTTTQLMVLLLVVAEVVVLVFVVVTWFGSGGVTWLALLGSRCSVLLCVQLLVELPKPY